MTRTELLWRHPDHPADDLSLGVEEDSASTREVSLEEMFEEILDKVDDVS